MPTSWQRRPVSRFHAAVSTRMLVASIALVALASAASAEGGLPGGLRTATEDGSAMSAARAAQADTADTVRAPEPGGALLIPFADTADLRAPRVEALDQRMKGGNDSNKGNGHVVAWVAAAVGLVVLTWVAARLP